MSVEEALQIYNRIPSDKRSFYFHPDYVINDTFYKKGVRPVFFAKEDGDNIYYHAFQLGEIPGTIFFDVQSPYGYGGPIGIGNQSFIDKCIESYKKWCVSNYVLIEFIRFHPLLENDRTYYGEVSYNRTVVSINLTTNDLFSEFSTRVRTTIRKAQKSSLSITFSKSQNVVKQFIELYVKLMDGKEADRSYYFCKEYFVDLLKNDNVYLLSVLNEEDLVIGASIFFVVDQIAEYHLSASNDEGRSKGVSNLLIYEFAKYAQSKGTKSLYLGGGTDRSEKNALLFFKRGFSRLESQFKIGNYKHNEVAYENMRCEFLKDNPGKEQLVLFYR
ncbi:GNAT family N-acetyltransferase [Paenibacillus sp. PK3_47]|uniref:GNAT family N-acetyltransferase n=1 Tax=Paenibacillus sp. PK3_47 TaxID=2072642 RepID=UPI00201D8C20|nr:GNAT family N-acetyltransferase [Paenibacillus sp. PK3_47]